MPSVGPRAARHSPNPVGRLGGKPRGARHVRPQPSLERFPPWCPRRLPAHAGLEAAARQPRVSGTGRRHLHQRSGDRRGRVSVSRGLLRQGSAGVLLSAGFDVGALSERHSRRYAAAGAASPVRRAAGRIGRHAENRDDAGRAHPRAHRGRGAGAGAGPCRPCRARRALPRTQYADGAGRDRQAHAPRLHAGRGGRCAAPAAGGRRRACRRRRPAMAGGAAD